MVAKFIEGYLCSQFNSIDNLYKNINGILHFRCRIDIQNSHNIDSENYKVILVATDNQFSETRREILIVYSENKDLIEIKSISMNFIEITEDNFPKIIKSIQKEFFNKKPIYISKDSFLLPAHISVGIHNYSAREKDFIEYIEKIKSAIKISDTSWVIN